MDDEDYEDEICSGCSGSGEGMYDGSRCYKCHGSGVEPVEKEDDDYEAD
jgi:DnaJ-class molecular chaperone